jgi:uncharacterized protein YggU (UPF0235/DUF167 family)
MCTLYNKEEDTDNNINNNNRDNKNNNSILSLFARLLNSPKASCKINMSTRTKKKAPTQNEQNKATCNIYTIIIQSVQTR